MRAVFVLATLAGFAAFPAAAAAPEPLTSFETRGPDLPPVGHSLFDHAMAVRSGGGWVLDVPWPFEALVERIGSHLGPAHREPMKRVLHPIGRSLHRNAAAPQYFRYPRAVGAVDTDPKAAPGVSGLMLKDRLYVGYQPLSDVLEVVSYNEAAGRFEYQVVSDYRAGGTPRVGYADRGLCLACHHNQAAIYAEQPWAETNNSNFVAALLLEEADEFYGIPARVPFDVPELFDDSTDRATYFAAYQRAWNEGCAAAGGPAEAIACRRDGLVSALRYRLSARYQLADPGDGVRARFGRALMRGWRARWPDGVAVLDSDIADFDPLARAGYGAGRSALETGLVERIEWTPPPALHFNGALEPLHERPPRAVWRVPRPFAGTVAVEPSWIDAVVAGLGDFLAPVDVARLDAHLAGAAAGVRRYAAACRVTAATDAVDFRCTGTPGGLKLAGRADIAADGAAGGIIGRVRAGSAAPGGLELTDGALRREGGGWRLGFALRDTVTGLGARLADGSAVRRVDIAWPDGAREATATVTAALDFQLLAAAVDRLAAATAAGESDALAALPFRRVAVLRPLFADLGLEPVDWCCLDSAHLPPPVHADDL